MNVRFLPAPPRWLEFRNWLLTLTNGDLRYVRAWIAKWMLADGRIPYHRSFDGQISAPNRLDDLPPAPEPPRKGVRFKRPGEPF